MKQKFNPMVSLIILSLVLISGGKRLSAADEVSDTRAPLAPTLQQGDRPNVLFIAIDDLNDWVGALGGHPQAQTPHLDQLARQGTLFTNAHTAAPFCNPSRAALLTGIRPSTSGIYYNNHQLRSALPNAVTLPQHFRQHGYYALGSGKMFHEKYPDPASWDEYAPRLTKQVFHFHQAVNKNGLNRGEFDWGPISVAESRRGDAESVDWVIRQLNQDFDQPFFLACGIFHPHLPLYAPSSYFELFPEETIQLPKVKENDLDDIPPAGLAMIGRRADHRAVTESGQWHKAVQGYLASTAFADRQLGRLLNALSRSRYADNTIIVLWSDHGWHLGEKQHWRKRTLWERATRVPLVFVVPQGTPALPQGTLPGRRSGRPVNLVDIYPTLIELAGLSHRQELEGASLVPLLRNPNGQWNRRSITTMGRNKHAVRSQRYRYIRYPDGSEELYDHKTDPNEFVNLAKNPRYADIIAAHRRWLPKVNAPNAPVEQRSNAKAFSGSGE